MGGLPKTSPRKKKHKNLIWLTAQEHYEAHRLLFEENPDNIGLALCWRNFHQRRASGNTPEVILISGDEYARLQENYHRLQHQRLSGENNPSYGKKHSPETIEKIKKAKTEQDLICPPHLGKQHSLETRKLLSELSKEQFSNPENRKKVSDSLKLYFLTNNSSNCKEVICIETGQHFSSASEASRWLVSKTGRGGHISESCRDSNKTAGGYH